jgi:hypothetical protein
MIRLKVRSAPPRSVPLIVSPIDHMSYFHIVAFHLIFLNKITEVLRTGKNTPFISGLIL